MYIILICRGADRLARANRRRFNATDVLHSLHNLGFDRYIPLLQECLDAHIIATSQHHFH